MDVGMRLSSKLGRVLLEPYGGLDMLLARRIQCVSHSLYKH